MFRCARNTAGSITNKSSRILCFPDVGCAAHSETEKLASSPHGGGSRVPYFSVQYTWLTNRVLLSLRVSDLGCKRFASGVELECTHGYIYKTGEAVQPWTWMKMINSQITVFSRTLETEKQIPVKGFLIVSLIISICRLTFLSPPFFFVINSLKQTCDFFFVFLSKW